MKFQCIRQLRDSNNNVLGSPNKIGSGETEQDCKNICQNFLDKEEIPLVRHTLLWNILESKPVNYSPQYGNYGRDVYLVYLIEKIV